MIRILTIIFFVLLFFFIEFLLFNLAGPDFMPDMLLLLVIFFNLSLGIRYSIFTAILAGILRDAFSAGVFGIHLCAFIVGAYLTTFLKRYIYHRGSQFSLLILVFAVTLADIAIHAALRGLTGEMNWADMARRVILPQIFWTLVSAVYTFHFLKRCVLKLFA